MSLGGFVPKRILSRDEIDADLDVSGVVRYFSLPLSRNFQFCNFSMTFWKESHIPVSAI